MTEFKATVYEKGDKGKRLTTITHRYNSITQFRGELHANGYVVYRNQIAPADVFDFICDTGDQWRFDAYSKHLPWQEGVSEYDCCNARLNKMLNAAIYRQKGWVCGK
jgi:hypothetical protein